MQLAQYYTEVEWNGNSIHLPINHDFERYSDSFDGVASPMSYLESCQYVPGAPTDPADVNLEFALTMALPLNQSGELYSNYFGKSKGFNVIGVEGDKLKLSFSAQAVCNIEDPERTDFSGTHCALAAQMMASNPAITKNEAEDFHWLSHVCSGSMEEAIWVVHEVGQKPAGAEWVEDELGFEDHIWSATLDEIHEEFEDPMGNHFMSEIVAEDKTYRLLVFTSRD